jgi:WD40 repeat protein
LAGIVNADRGGVTRLWNTDTGAQLAEVCCQTQSGQLPLFSPDGSIVLAVSMDPKNGQLVALDADSGAEIKVLCCVYGYTDFIAFSPNGAYLAIPSYNGKPARIWNTQTWSEIAILPYESARIDSRIRFSPDNSRLITTSGDGKPRLWDTATAAEIAVLRGHRGSIRTAEFSPNMNRVLTTSDDGTARLWDISGIKGQSAFEIACQRLSDREFTDAEQKFGVDIDRPICEGKPPLP